MVKGRYLVSSQLSGFIRVSYSMQNTAKVGQTSICKSTALAQWEQSQYDMILMDCQMPVMDGYEDSKIIRQQEHGHDKHIPFIALTANAMEGDRDKCLDAGMDDFIAKPFQLAVLEEVIGRWLK